MRTENMFIRPRNPPTALTGKMGGMPKKVKIFYQFLFKKRRSIAFIYRKKLLIMNFNGIFVQLSDYIK
jgi:hypothetical protein